MDMPDQLIALENDLRDWRKTKNKSGDSFAPRGPREAYFMLAGVRIPPKGKIMLVVGPS
jgi:hypothetical protein